MVGQGKPRPYMRQTAADGLELYPNSQGVEDEATLAFGMVGADDIDRLVYMRKAFVEVLRKRIRLVPYRSLLKEVL